MSLFNIFSKDNLVLSKCKQFISYFDILFNEGDEIVKKDCHIETIFNEMIDTICDIRRATYLNSKSK